MKQITKEEKIKNIAFELIPKKLRFSLLHLLSDVCINIKEPITFDSEGEVTELKKEIENLVCEINDTLLVSMDKRVDFCERVKVTQKKIIEIMQSVYVYNIFNNSLLNAVNAQRNIRIFKQDEHFNKGEFNYSAICEDCIDFIYNFENQESFKGTDLETFMIGKKKSQILSCLPLKMTKEKYNDYLTLFFKNIMNNVSKNFVVNSMEILKNEFLPVKSEYFGKKFSYIAEKLLEIYKMDIPSFSDEEIDEIIDTLQDIENDISEIIETITSLYNDTNYILNIALFSVDDEYLFDDDIMFKDLYFTTRNCIKSKDDEIFIEETLEKMYDRIEVLESEIYAMDKNFDDILNMIDIDNVSEDVYTYVMTKMKIDENFYNEIDEGLNNYYNTEENSAIADEKFITAKIAEFIEYIKNVLSDIPNKEAKKIKAEFFDNIICFVEDKEFNEYIEFVFQSLNNDENSNFTVINLSNLFSKTGYDNDEDFDDECSCGHHHHHHECDCGEHHHNHHHHHHHECDCGEHH